MSKRNCLTQCLSRDNVISVESETKNGSDGKVVSIGAEEAEDARSQLVKLLSRYWPLLVLSWCMELSLGAAISMPGPTLPYLALKIREPLDRLGFVFTGSSLTSCLAAWLTGLALDRLAGNNRAKLIGLLLGNALLVAALISTPQSNSLAGLIAAQCTMGAGVAVISTVDNMLVIFLFGPILSRSLSHSLHFCIGVGGFLAPLLARPFLISMGDIGSGGDVCGPASRDYCSRINDSLANAATVAVKSASEPDLQPLHWPFVIVACLHGVCFCGYGLLLLVKFQFDRYQEFDYTDASSAAVAVKDNPESTSVANAVNETAVPSRQKWIVVSLFVFFYVLHAGQESGFWSYLYSFGVCSRLCLSPDQASLLNTVFFVGYLLSRGTGVLVSRLVRPTVMLIIQLAGCLMATSLLAGWGDTHLSAAYIGVAMYGLCIAMVFPTGITWLAERIDVTGALASTWSIGTYIGASTYPLSTGFLIGVQNTGAIAMMYLAAAVSAAYLLVALAMMLAARGIKHQFLNSL